MSAAPLVYRIGSVAVPLGSRAATRAPELGEAVRRALAARLPDLPRSVAGRVTLHVPGGRVFVERGAQLDEIAAAIAGLVHGHLVQGGAR